MVLFWCLFIIRTWRQGAFRFFYVGILMLVEVHHLDILVFIHGISDDKIVLLQLFQKRFNVYIVIRENLCLDSLRPVFETPLTVSDTPKPNK